MPKIQNSESDNSLLHEHIKLAFERYGKNLDSRKLLASLKFAAECMGGLGWLAKATKLNREHLYRMLTKGGNPRLSSLSLILDAFGLSITVTISNKDDESKKENIAS